MSFSKSSGLVIATTLLLNGTIAVAADDVNATAKGDYGNVSIFVEGGATQTYGQKVRYNYDVTSDTFVDSDSKLSGDFYRTGLSLALPNVSSFGFINPTLSFVGSIEQIDATTALGAIGDTANNSILAIDGTIGDTAINNIEAGEIRQKNKTKTFDIVLADHLGQGWDIAPVVGLSVRSFDQNYTFDARINPKTNVAEVIDSKLRSNMTGLQLGAVGASPRWNGLRMVSALNVKAYYASTKNTAIQDRNSEYTSYSNLTENDAKTHLVAIPQLSLGLDYQFNAFSLVATIGASYSYGMPLIRMPSKVGERAGIDSDNGALSTTSTVKAIYAF